MIEGNTLWEKKKKKEEITALFNPRPLLQLTMIMKFLGSTVKLKLVITEGKPALGFACPCSLHGLRIPAYFAAELPRD